MTNIGLPVSQGLTIITKACIIYYEDGMELNLKLMNISSRWKKLLVRNLEIKKIHF